MGEREETAKEEEAAKNAPVKPRSPQNSSASGGPNMSKFANRQGKVTSLSSDQLFSNSQSSPSGTSNAAPSGQSFHGAQSIGSDAYFGREPQYDNTGAGNGLDDIRDSV